MDPALFERAVRIALDAHRGQRDKGGGAYLLHPLSVMARVHGDAARLVALLHDVVEDSDWTLDQLRDAGFPEAVVAAVDALTRRADEPYEDALARAAANPLARAVKRADLEDNLDVRRLGEIAPRDVERLERYRRALDTLAALPPA